MDKNTKIREDSVDSWLRPQRLMTTNRTNRHEYKCLCGRDKKTEIREDLVDSWFRPQRLMTTNRTNRHEYKCLCGLDKKTEIRVDSVDSWLKIKGERPRITQIRTNP